MLASCYSSALVRDSSDSPAKNHTVGCLTLTDIEPNFTPSEEFSAFLAAWLVPLPCKFSTTPEQLSQLSNFLASSEKEGVKPAYVGFGSMTLTNGFEDRGGAHLTKLCLTALKEAEVLIVL